MSAAPPGPHAEVDAQADDALPGADQARHRHPAGATARDALGERLLGCGAPAALTANKLGTTIDGSHAAQGRGRVVEPAAAGRPELPAGAGRHDDDDPRIPPAARTPTSACAGVGGARPPQRARTARWREPVAGGPRKRGKTRGECPSATRWAWCSRAATPATSTSRASTVAGRRSSPPTRTTRTRRSPCACSGRR